MGNVASSQIKISCCNRRRVVSTVTTVQASQAPAATVASAATVAPAAIVASAATVAPAAAVAPASEPDWLAQVPRRVGGPRARAAAAGFGQANFSSGAGR